MRKGVLFDMDGVLVDNREAHMDSFVEFLWRYGLELPYDQLVSMFGMTNKEIMPAMLPADLIAEKGIDALSREKEAVYRELYTKTIAPVPGLIPFIHILKENGFKIAVGSSGIRENIDFVLEKLGISDCFNAIVDGEMVSNGKPAPDIYLKAAELLDLSPDECVVLEDSFAGIQAARSAGMAVVTVATTFPKNEHTDYDLLVSDFTELNIDQIRTL